MSARLNVVELSSLLYHARGSVNVGFTISVLSVLGGFTRFTLADVMPAVCATQGQTLSHQ